MVNIWDYATAGKVSLLDIDGRWHEGSVVCVNDTDEMYDAQEDEITIQTSDGRIIGFKQSEIDRINVIQ